jgi:hypothetical protein
LRGPKEEDMNSRKALLITLLAILLIFGDLAIARPMLFDKARENTLERISPSYIYPNHIYSSDNFSGSDIYSSDIYSSDNVWVS